jgi:hypothetical protein
MGAGGHRQEGGAAIINLHGTENMIETAVCSAGGRLA